MHDCRLRVRVILTVNSEPKLNFTSSAATVSVDIRILHTLWRITQKRDNSDPPPLTEAVLIRSREPSTVVANQTIL